MSSAVLGMRVVDVLESARGYVGRGEDGGGRERGPTVSKVAVASASPARLGLLACRVLRASEDEGRDIVDEVEGERGVLTEEALAEAAGQFAAARDEYVESLARATWLDSIANETLFDIASSAEKARQGACGGREASGSGEVGDRGVD